MGSGAWEAWEEDGRGSKVAGDSPCKDTADTIIISNSKAGDGASNLSQEGGESLNQAGTPNSRDGPLRIKDGTNLNRVGSSPQILMAHHSNQAVSEASATRKC